MRCKRVNEKLNAYVDAELTAKMYEEIASHLELCHDCRQAMIRLKKLAILLEETSTPAVPEYLLNRVTAQARLRAASGRPVPQTLRNPFRWWVSVSVPMRAAVAVVLVIGLAIGVFMGRDTWQRPGMQIIANVQTAKADPVAIYNLDYLTDAPNRSLAQVYLTLTSTQNRGGQ